MWNEVFIYDYEVTKYDWLCVYKNHQTGARFRFHNDPEGLRAFLDSECWYVGYNNRGYDRYIVKGILSGCTPEEVKEINDWIIIGNLAWECPLLQYKKTPPLIDIDLMQDTQQGTSLKSFEAHMGMDIKESTIPFDIDRPLTDAEVEEMFVYCEADVDATEKLLEIRKDYIDTKVYLAELKGLDVNEAVTLTNARLTAKFLGAIKKEFNDANEWVYPENLKTQYIPQEVFDFFEDLRDHVYGEKVDNRLYEFFIGECKMRIGLGGAHGSIDNITVEKDDCEVFINLDITSYYPHLIVIYDYMSRCVADSKGYENVLTDRKKAKAKKNKKTANALKLVVNGTSGCLRQPTSELYDPLQGNSMCISGQLFIIELLEHLYQDIDNLMIIQANTDGIAIKFPQEHLDAVMEIVHEWESRTKFELEQDDIQAMYQKDVNNYIEVKTDKSVKVKGGMLVRGISTAGAFKINNNAPMVATAIIKYFTENTPPEETIMASTDIFDFQLIAKASHSYKAVMWEKNGELVQVQKCNRVYASKNLIDGTLFKVKGNAKEKIASIPDNCFIDNSNEATIEQVDKLWYVNLAYQQIQQFKGEKKNMATTAAKKEEKVVAIPTSLPKKLLTIRNEFRKLKIEQSGYNPHGGYSYYDLPDIVVPATEVLNKFNTMFLTNFKEGVAIGTLVDLDTDKEITFEFPMTKISEPAKFRMNEVQALGAELTYMRRYLYYLLLDITNKDEFDSAAPPKQEVTIETMKTPTTKAEAKKVVVNTEAKADDVILEGIKKGLKKLAAIDPNGAKMIAKAVQDKKDTLTKAEAMEIAKGIKAALTESEKSK